jgi:transcriptional regulator with XRE-family HTH domain
MIKEELDIYTDEMFTTISNNVRKYRKLKNYSQLQLALDIGLTGNAFLSRAEKRATNTHFNIEHLLKIAKILEIDICNFFKE